MTEILMPKATAVWLVDNTSLSFEQIAAFCGLHPLEVKGIADGDVAAGVRGADPIANGQLSREEIQSGEDDAEYRLVLRESKHADLLGKATKTKGPRYTPLSRRQERPNAIAWMVKNHPEVSDGQISKLIGTTKTTIEAVRSRTHWNASNITPTDPVALGLCSQVDLDEVVRKAAEKRRKAGLDAPAEPEGAGLKPASETGAADEAAEMDEADRRREPVSADDVFARFTGSDADASTSESDDTEGGDEQN